MTQPESHSAIFAYAARCLPEDEIVNAEPPEEREKSGGRFGTSSGDGFCLKASPQRE